MALAIGNGKAGLEKVMSFDEYGEVEKERLSGNTMLVFCKDFDGALKDVEDKFFDGENLNVFIDKNKDDCIRALKSFAVVKPRGRKFYEETIEMLPEDKRADYKAKYHDEHLSSMSDFVGYAWKLAKALETEGD